MPLNLDPVGMTLYRPLHETNPEFSVHLFPGYYEYRVENWRLARDGSGRVIHNVSSFGWVDAFAFIFASILLQSEDRWWLFLAMGILCLIRLWLQCTQVLSESLIILPPHGIQLETRRGLLTMCLSTTRRFIPLVKLHDMIINEGLNGWDICHYLVAIRHTNKDRFSISVAFENILPPHTILLHVYYGAHIELLRKEDT
ncbi:hypothetical protein BDZ94DRAFT_1273770 [Collybia nuda]|uniref:Phosphatidylinositol N-acetylglucosaminyltransferase subunit H conserved domain-containing protein n=1 Tax=Collybia nuda TaxID=64659 RepID=A0A9P5XV09_9AGAR|nr:hypothetical protein BDZ94DRAFT_1273770 [Collybia nuda]